MDLKYLNNEILWDALLTGTERLCKIFWGPTEDFCEQMLESSFLQPFEAIAPGMEARWAANVLDLHHLLDGFSDSISLFAYLEQGYVRLFVNNREGIAAPLYASCYEDEENPHLMGDAAARMRKTLSDLGIGIGDDVGEPPDHLSIEIEVLYFLLTRDSGPDHRASTARAADFAAQSMLPWVNRFYLRLADEVHCRFYPLITAVLLGVLHVVADMGKRNGV